MAEAHPVGFQWVMEAKARGARVIHVDPRFTRTSALADQHVTVRAGTDIAFLERFHYMLRVVKPSSPMSVGTWILTAYGAGSGLAAAAELLPPSLPASMPGRLLHAAGRPAGLSAAVFAPGVASYTAALLAQTAVPAWHEARRELPFVFTGSAAASGGGLSMLLAPVAEAGPARRLAAAGAASCPPAPLSASSAPPCTSAAISTLSRSSFRRSGSSVPSPRCSSRPGGSAGDRRSEATWATVVTQGFTQAKRGGKRPWYSSGSSTITSNHSLMLTASASVAKTA